VTPRHPFRNRIFIEASDSLPDLHIFKITYKLKLRRAYPALSHSLGSESISRRIAYTHTDRLRFAYHLINTATMQAMPDARQQSFEEIYGPPENFLEIEVRAPRSPDSSIPLLDPPSLLTLFSCPPPPAFAPNLLLPTNH
jgi:hypothetical protein